MAYINPEKYPKISNIISNADAPERILLRAVCSRMGDEELRYTGEEAVIKAVRSIALAGDLCAIEGAHFHMSEQITEVIEDPNTRNLSKKWIGTSLFSRSMMPLFSLICECLHEDGGVFFPANYPRDLVVGLAAFIYRWMEECRLWTQVDSSFNWDGYFFTPKDPAGKSLIEKQIFADLQRLYEYIKEMVDIYGQEYAVNAIRDFLGMESLSENQDASIVEDPNLGEAPADSSAHNLEEEIRERQAASSQYGDFL